MATVSLSTSEPSAPDADFAIYVDFDRSAEHPQRIFQAVEGLISAFEKLDKVLAHSIDASIEPVMVLEDIEAGSLKVWLRDKLLQTEDQALYSLDWKPLVGKYLVAAKYAFVRWVNDSEERSRPGSLADLRNEFLALAKQTDVKFIPSYGVPSAADILSSATDVSKALARLAPTDKAAFISKSGDENFDLSMDWEGLDLASLAVRETILVPPAPMILAVRRPDYLGSAQWEFRHGKRTIRAKITDEKWLKKFQARQVDVRPGDALRCTVTQEVRYGYDNELISEAFVVEEIVEVLENQYRQDELFDPDERGEERLS
ncbi:hypothetical protein H9L12_08345 [Sphingomonas rhizophila]|uniref:Uncharacterized protein n=1 Tax=Sphingomonas rhizophila TaxID=2071607 RepID=A0A7G9S916_9SPHN|nr:hypothetical protein [Sphingomonas rhizophila]QNN64341.1 hypothetical protein H9L12_08345 [Sphingomonas rhizophila]